MTGMPSSRLMRLLTGFQAPMANSIFHCSSTPSMVVKPARYIAISIVASMKVSGSLAKSTSSSDCRLKVKRSTSGVWL